MENLPELLDWTLFRWWLDGTTVQGYTHQIVVLGLGRRRPDPDGAAPQTDLHPVHPRRRRTLTSP
ncbi:hypothetical protein ABZ894_10560 [Nocardia beijingensis]|uniref:hypothetical protein n=1 Tax=Nocardia beijingensis TaxID=95162 RepID=UPI003410271C